VGDILVWRADSKGWYRELLRKFKRDHQPSQLPPPLPSLSSHPGSSSGSRPLATGATGGAAISSAPVTTAGTVKVAEGVVSLMMNPDKHKAQMLAHTMEPNSVKIFSTATYRATSVCLGSSTAGLCAHGPGGNGWMAQQGKELRSVFSRASLSADGRMVVAGCPGMGSGSGSGAGSGTVLRVWDAQTGSVISSPISDHIMFPFAIRSVGWHPKQHMIAVAMVSWCAFNDALPYCLYTLNSIRP
jgi:hypothetical protein